MNTLDQMQALIAMQALYEIFNSGRYNLYNQHRQAFNNLDRLVTDMYPYFGDLLAHQQK